MTHPHQEFRADHTPLAYLITFRSYGTWLHGRGGSVDRFHNKYGAPRLPANIRRWQRNRGLLKQPPVKLGKSRRDAVENAIRETCKIRRWLLWALNIRSNHVRWFRRRVHLKWCWARLKANATRKMRETGCWNSERTPWVFRGSKRRIWTERQLLSAITYVLYDQGEPMP